jgi:hypothetical protein
VWTAAARSPTASGGNWEKLRNMQGTIEVASADLAVIVNEAAQSREF